MRILYFAWVRQKIGMSEEAFTPSDATKTVADLLGELRGRGGGYAEALDEAAAIRVAVNQEFAALDAAIAPGDEIAIFPPVTGG